MPIEERNEFVEKNMKLVHHIIKRYYPSFWNDEDIVQAGMVGLILAVDNWDEERGKFSTFACTCIRNEIRHEFKRRLGDVSDSAKSLDEGVRGMDGEKTLADTVVGDHNVELSTLTLYGDSLNDREKFVLEQFVGGKSLTEIAKEAGVATQTMSRVYRIACLKIKDAIDKMDKEGKRGKTVGR